MKLTRTIAIAALALAACSGEKVQPADSNAAEAALTPAEKEARTVAEYKKRQAAFADSVLNTVTPTTKVVEKLGKGYAVGTLAMRDSLVAFVGRTPQCYRDGKGVDPYLAGTVTFAIHLSVIGSDIIRVQESQWTSQAGNISDKCFNDAARQWKLPMGMAKQGWYVLQVQFK